MIGNQRNRVNRIVLIVLSFLFVISIGVNVNGQVAEGLTDREILIQLIEKFGYFEQAVLRIEFNSDITRNKIISIDRKIDKNSIGISNLSETHKATILRWNTLLGLFVTFILGIFIWMWKRSYK